jgi:two-component system nitrate/nitrite sensor histidine kinase NarX
VENLRLDLLDEEKQLQVYRIVQEALTNIKKHAEAGEAVVVMRMNNGGGYISVSDDGKGFSPDSPAGKRFRDNGGAGKRTEVHLGIRGMYERAAILGGNLSIESNGPGEGVTVQLIIPLEARDG